MKVSTDEAKIDEVLSRGVEQILPSRDELKKLLLSGKKIRLYQGFDPTGDKLHLGHLAGLRKLRQFQDLGHEVIFLIGDGTGQAGDPSGKTVSRTKFFTQPELKANAKKYKQQSSKVLRFTGANPIKIKYNSQWLNRLKLPDLLNIIGHFSLQQLIERQLFQERLKQGEPVNLREFIYPLLQGYDSVALKTDLEIGGTDQLFNMLTGRTLVRDMLDRNKFVLTLPLLADNSGRKIGKSEGNAIALDDSPSDLFGKIMSLNDDIIIRGFEYLTTVPLARIEIIKKELAGGANPIEFKKELAFTIVESLSSTKLATKAAEDFSKTFSNKELPEQIEKVKAQMGETLADTLIRIGLVESKSAWRRLVEAGAIKTATGEKVSDPNHKVAGEATFKIGKHRFITIYS